MAERVAFNFGGHFHYVAKGVNGGEMTTDCGKVRQPEWIKAVAMGSQIPEKFRCEKCFAPKPAAAPVVQLPAYLAEIVGECEWRAAMDARIDATARMEGWKS